MKITLVSHASLLVQTSDTLIWSDPWLFGSAFNDSWRLDPPAVWEPSLLDSINFLWLSHEHPDHFHVPTLRSLPDSFKQRVVILFQENNSEKMFDALKRFGYTNFRRLPHGKLVSLSQATQVYCYQVGQMDSALAINNCAQTILNLNDCEVNSSDLKRIRRTIKRCDVLLNQFSIAGSNGYVDGDPRQKAAAKRILSTMIQNHIDMGAVVTIPIASFMYFSTSDNKHMNKYANKIPEVVRCFEERGLGVAALYPGDSFSPGENHDSSQAIERFERSRNELGDEAFTSSITVPLADLMAQYREFVAVINERYPAFLLRLLKPVTVVIPDLAICIRFSIPNSTIEVVDQSEPDLEIHSQPLSFAFSNTFGFQTLGVSARYIVFRNSANWRRHRILFSLNNAELYLRPHLFFRKRNLAWFVKRLPGATNQLLYKVRRMS